jgi:hypothetical protein
MDGDLRPREEPRPDEAFKQRMLAAVPAWYSPWGHLAGTLGVGVATLALALTQLADLRAVELWTLPVTFVVSNLIEWFTHRYFMHQRRFPLTVLYDRHTPEHHRAYRYETMAIVEPKELRLVLIPAAGVLGMVVFSVPAALALAALLSANVGWLFLATVAVYVVGYEVSHLAYHLPESSVVYRLPLFSALRRHHARHHLPRLMQTKNFNVTIPLGDLLFGTLATRAELEAALARETTRARHGQSTE